MFADDLLVCAANMQEASTMFQIMRNDHPQLIAGTTLICTDE
jgi:hypothetical protein